MLQHQNQVSVKNLRITEDLLHVIYRRESKPIMPIDLIETLYPF